MLYEAFSTATSSATNRVKSFTAYMKSDEARSLLQHSARAWKEHADGLQPWRVTEHPDWFGRVELAGEVDGMRGEGEDDEVSEEKRGEAVEHDVMTVLESFKVAHPDLKVERIEKSGVEKDNGEKTSTEKGGIETESALVVSSSDHRGSHALR
jgi:hypothetical protein